MIRTCGWSDVARAVRPVMMAGPRVSATAAAASVARLRRAVRWSDPMLAGLSALPEAAERVAHRPSVVVDRRGALDLCAGMIDRAMDGEDVLLGPGAWGRTPVGTWGPLSLGAAGVVLTRLVPRIRGLWDPFERRRILVAPTVLSTGDRCSLDQIDHSRWVALRTGLWGVLFEQAPWLGAHLVHLSRTLPRTTGDLVRLVVLADALVARQMEALTPQDIPSAQWLRHHAPGSAGFVGLDALRLLGLGIGDLTAQHTQAEGFAREVIAAGSLDALLLSADHLPTREELERPQAWVSRVGL